MKIDLFVGWLVGLSDCLLTQSEETSKMKNEKHEGWTHQSINRIDRSMKGTRNKKWFGNGKEGKGD